MTAPTAPALPDSAASTAQVVAVDGVSKFFGDVVSVSEVSFTLDPGVTAMLGPNGAGKSTLLRMLCGLTAPDQGTVRVLGVDPRTHLGVRGRIGIVPQQEAVFEPLDALAFVRLAAVLNGVADPDLIARQALATVELDPGDRRKVTAYSKGMRQRVKVAQALVGDPVLLVLDEPLTGLDPRQRAHLIDLFARLGEQGRCVVVSSHVLDEVERFGSRVLVVAQGRLAATGDFHAIRDLMDDRPHQIRVRTDHPRALASALLDTLDVSAVRLEAPGPGRPGAVIIDTNEAARFRRLVAAAARDIGATLWEVTPLDDDLESVFRYLVQP